MDNDVLDAKQSLFQHKLTISYFILGLVFSSFVNFGFLNPYSVCFTYKHAFSNFEPWRLVTAFLYFGMFNYSFIIKFCVGIYSLGSIESINKQNKTYSRFIWSLILFHLLLLLFSSIYPLYFLSNAFFMVLLTIRCNLDSKQSIQITETIKIKMSYVPFAYMAFNVLCGSGFLNYVIGILIGYLYLFLKNPEFIRKNGDYLNPPLFLKKYFGERFEQIKKDTNQPQFQQKPKTMKQANSFVGKGVRIG